MINNDVFTTVVFMFMASILSILIILGVLVWSLVDLKFGRFNKFWQVKYPITILALIILYLGLPWWFLGAAYYQTDDLKAVNLYKLAINVAVIPSVKSNIYQSLGSHYMMTYKGEEAIEAYELAYKFYKDDLTLAQLCVLYTIKGDRDSAIATCVQNEHNQMAAINGILGKNYTVALNLMNMEIKKDRTPSCWDYAVRGYIYRALNMDSPSQDDFKKSSQMCPNNERLKELYSNKNYYEEFYAKRKVQYGF